VSILQLDGPTFYGLWGRDFYILEDADEQRKIYLDLIKETLILLGTDEANATRNADEIMRFEIALANVRPATKAPEPLCAH
jgi:predicted metalloendopeptidase